MLFGMLTTETALVLITLGIAGTFGLAHDACHAMERRFHRRP